MKRLLVIFFILLFSFCSKKEKSPYPHVTLPKSKNAVQVNTKGMLHILSDSEESFFMPNFKVDTNVSSDPKWNSKNIKEFNYEYVMNLPHFDFKIIIDTSYTIAVKGFEYKNTDLTPEGHLDFSKVFALWKDDVVCYPLLIYNNGTKPAYSYYISLIQQAKDKDGKWQPIEYFANFPSCIPSPFCQEHLPKQYTAKAIIKYNGDFKTKIRVKVKMGKNIYYSNEIDGYINYSQFDKAPVDRFIETFKPGLNKEYHKEYLTYLFLEEKEN